MTETMLNNDRNNSYTRLHFDGQDDTTKTFRYYFFWLQMQCDLEVVIEFLNLHYYSEQDHIIWHGTTGDQNKTQNLDFEFFFFYNVIVIPYSY